MFYLKGHEVPCMISYSLSFDINENVSGWRVAKAYKTWVQTGGKEAEENDKGAFL